MTRPASRWPHPCLLIAATGPADRGSCAPLCPPLVSHPTTSASSPSLWPWFYLLPPAFPPHRSPHRQLLVSKASGNLLVKRPKLD
jgi:hypothetical protein